LSTREGITRRYIRRLVNLAFLSPQLVEAILQGRQPIELTATRLTELICRSTGASSTDYSQVNRQATRSIVRRSLDRGAPIAAEGRRFPRWDCINGRQRKKPNRAPSWLTRPVLLSLFTHILGRQAALLRLLTRN
jgi:hypothetical protein